jgi:hypothetical protein
MKISRPLTIGGIAVALLAPAAQSAFAATSSSSPGAMHEQSVTLANQSGNIGSGASRTFKTWFWGRTEVCVKNLGPGDGPFYWISGPSGAPGEAAPGQTTCFTRSFVGIPITIYNEGGTDTLQVTFPIGP